MKKIYINLKNIWWFT